MLGATPKPLGTVLIVDDEPSFVDRVVRPVLAGWTLVVLHDDRSLRAFLADPTTRADVAIVDLRFNGLDIGHQFMLDIGDRFPGARIVLLTGFPRPDIANICYRAHTDDLVKESDAETQELLREFLERAKLTRQVAWTAIRRVVEEYGQRKVGFRRKPRLTQDLVEVLYLRCRGYKRKDIAERLRVDEETVKSELAQIKDRSGGKAIDDLVKELIARAEGDS